MSGLPLPSFIKLNLFFFKIVLIFLSFCGYFSSTSTNRPFKFFKTSLAPSNISYSNPSTSIFKYSGFAIWKIELIKSNVKTGIL